MPLLLSHPLLLADTSVTLIAFVVIITIFAIAKALEKKTPEVPKPWEPSDDLATSDIPPPLPPMGSEVPPPLPRKKPKIKSMPSAKKKTPTPFATVQTAPEPEMSTVPPLANVVPQPPARIQTLLKKNSLRNAILMSEILQPPPGLRD